MTITQRARQVIDIHVDAGIMPASLVMNTKTLVSFVTEHETTYYWWPRLNSQSLEYQFLGIPIVVRNFLPDGEVIAGV